MTIVYLRFKPEIKNILGYINFVLAHERTERLTLVFYRILLMIPV